jgi:hypothetical protein
MLGFQSNPLVVRLTSKRTWLPLRACFWLAFVLGLIGLAFSSAALLNAHDERRNLALLPFILLALLALIPAIVAIITAVLTARNTHGESYELLKATDISDAGIVQGHFFAALHQARILLVLAVGAVPAIVVGMFEFTIILQKMTCMFSSDGVVSNCIPPSASVGLAWLPISIGLLGLNAVAAALGVRWSLQWRGTATAAVLGPLLMLVLSVIATGFWLPAFLSAKTIRLVTWLIVFAWMYIPYAVAVGIMQNAERWARKQ